MFQSTHPYGCDNISNSAGYGGCSFNPRTHTGATRRSMKRQHDNMFQSTHPYGCDPAFLNGVLVYVRFQSTHPYGCDPVWLACDDTVFVFQSTHPYGCDVSQGGNGVIKKGFQSTHPYGCDLLTALTKSRSSCFNPRTHTGAT